MYGILVSAFSTALGWLVRTVIIKFVVFTAIYLITSKFIQLLMNRVATSSLGGLQDAVSGTPGAVLWGFSVIRIDFGLPAVLAAYGLRFAIRRMPVIG